MFRVTTRLPAGPQEGAFRLVFEDVTRLAAPAAGTNAMQVVLRVNHNLPVFFAAAGSSMPEPGVTACEPRPKPGSGCVRVEYSGNSFVFVKSIAVAGSDWRQDLPASGRLLAGAWKQWEFELPAIVGGQFKASVDTSAGPVSGVISLD